MADLWKVHAVRGYRVQDIWDVAPEYDVVDTGHVLRGTGIDSVDIRMSVLATNECYVQHASEMKVAHIRGLAGNQAGVFFSANPGANVSTEYHRLSLSSRQVNPGSQPHPASAPFSTRFSHIVTGV
jgi:hypothetical protein